MDTRMDSWAREVARILWTRAHLGDMMAIEDIVLVRHGLRVAQGQLDRIVRARLDAALAASKERGPEVEDRPNGS